MAMNREVIVIIGAFVVAVYLTVLNVTYPLIGIDVVEKKNGDVVVSGVYEFGWAEQHGVRPNDRVIKINGKHPRFHNTVKKYHVIEQAKTITIQRRNQVQTLRVDMKSHGVAQWAYYILLPTIFFVFTIRFSIFLLRLRPHDKSAIVLIYFLLLMGLCYVSASLSAKYEPIGRQLFNGIFLALPTVFLHFVYKYFEKEKKVWFAKTTVFFLYGLNVSLVFALLTAPFHSIDETNVLLLACLINMSSVFTLLAKGWKKLQGDALQHTIKGIVFAISSSTIPFLFFYSFPMLVMKKWILPAELTVIFLFALPTVFFYLMATDQLFQLPFSIGRLKYLGLFALFPSFFIMIVYNQWIRRSSKWAELVVLFSVVYIIVLATFYIKEWLDRKWRAKLRMQKHFYEESLYRISEQLKKQRTVEGAMYCLEKELQEILDVEKIEVIQSINEPLSFEYNQAHWANIVKKINGAPLSIGRVMEHRSLFVVFIGSFHETSLWLVGKKKRPLSFRTEQKDWLSTIVYYTSMTIENMLKVEELLKELDRLKETEHSISFTRLMFQWSERERKKLAIDLHDTLLQDLILLRRKVENLLVQPLYVEDIQKQLNDIEEEILDVIDVTREICHELRPPFLSQMGLKQAISQLIARFHLRTNIKVKWNVHIQAKLGEEQELAMYRIIQELLNNAVKHSQASTIQLVLDAQDEAVQLCYVDDGVGIEMEKLNDHHDNLGLFGIKERVQGLGGTCKIASSHGSGLEITVTIPL
ncbi:ATP-binding protein [Anoxybacillus flavithermus]|uniref:histidine kinase n=1 Tax=Anoxybacillus flavithermus (strain DSM 21510 / WK1) TaxID=491915 RepID=B7GGX5_ANOFW|nr:ATP-binding protein [Anoxybacillus flavithermus]ACJ32930.1 Signal transduction histidine kinase, contains N-terminal PDZ domain [Anoxybacillus flavithermus WK1]